MQYHVVNRNRRYHPATLWTKDGVIVAATQAYQWAIGRTFTSMMSWWETHDRTWRLLSAETYPPAGYLRHHVPQLRTYLDEFFGLQRDGTQAPVRPKKKVRLGVGFASNRMVPYSRDRSLRLWKKLIKRALPPNNRFKAWEVESAVVDAVNKNTYFYKRVEDGKRTKKNMAYIRGRRVHGIGVGRN